MGAAMAPVEPASAAAPATNKRDQVLMSVLLCPLGLIRGAIKFNRFL
jgi:hypothetical protein